MPGILTFEVLNGLRHIVCAVASGGPVLLHTVTLVERLANQRDSGAAYTSGPSPAKMNRNLIRLSIFGRSSHISATSRRSANEIASCIFQVFVFEYRRLDGEAR